MWEHVDKSLKNHLEVKYKNLGANQKGNNGWNQINNGINERLGHQYWNQNTL